MRSVIPGLWNPLAYIAGGGLALRWFRDQFFTSRGETHHGRGRSTTCMADAGGEIPPGADGLFFSPHLGGRICPAAPAMRGAWVGFSWGHTQAHFFRAMLESIAFEYAYYLSILRELIPDLSLIEARVIGGGARSAVWNQIKADVLGVPYQRLSAGVRHLGRRDDRRARGWAVHRSGRDGAHEHWPPGRVAQAAPGKRRDLPGMAEQYARWQSVLAETF